MSETKTPRQSFATIRRLHRLLRSNWITSLGAALMTLAVMGFLTIILLSLIGGEWDGPYSDIMLAVAMPALFVFGMVLIPAGLLLYRKSLHQRLSEAADQPVSLARAVVGLTAINFAAIGTLGYGGTHYMSSNQFCGAACHKAMEPEYVAYENSPHRRVDCVKCHVAPGATGHIAAKLNGTRQLYQYVTDSFRKPIPKPVDHQLPAEQTCEQCHDPEGYLGTKLEVYRRFREDEKVSGYTNVLLLRRGGTRPDGSSVGIHWHVHPDTVVEYVATDENNTQIPWVRVVRGDGVEELFAAPGQSHDTPPEGKIRKMDCTDCHNRTGHEFEDPSHALDEAIAHGLVPRELPFIKKRALAALRGVYTRENAPDGIRQNLQSAYAADGGLDEETRKLLEPAIAAITDIWERNIFPDIKIGWNTYPALDGHFGCFRCHDGQHKTPEGRAIFGPPQGKLGGVERRNACDRCHVVLSENNENPAVLKAFGLGK